MKAKWRPIALVAGGLLLTIIIGVLMHRGGDALAVTTVIVKPTDIVVKLPENGIISLPQTAAIAAKSAGTVNAIYTHEGRHVKAGDLLMKLDDRAAAATVSRDAAAAAQADAALMKARQAAVGGSSNVQGLAQAQQTLLAAQAKLHSDVNSKREGALSAVSGVAGLGMSGQSQLVQQEQAVTVARAQLLTAKERYDGDLQLYKINGLPRQQLDADRALYDEAQANASAAQRQYDLTKQQLRDNAGQLDQQIEADKQAVASAQAALGSAQYGARENIAAVDVRSAQASLDSAQAQLQLDQQQLADTEVRAPFDGVIQTLGTAPTTTGTTAALAVGDAVQPGQILFTIAGAGPMIVRAQVDEQDIINVKVGQHVFISGQDFPEQKLIGTVIRIAPVVVAQNQGTTSAKNVETTISLARTYPFLRDGMSADVDIVTGKATHALTVPTTAVVQDGKKRFVYVIKDRTAHKTLVRQGLASDTEVVIVSGLKTGDEVVANPPSTLKDGLRVQAAQATPAPTSSS